MLPTDINVAMWEKFVFIFGSSGVRGIYPPDNRPISRKHKTRTMLFNAMKESTAVARARGAALSERFVSDTMIRINTIQPRALASMQKILWKAVHLS